MYILFVFFRIHNKARSNLSSEQSRAVCLSLWFLSLWNRGELWRCLSSRMDKWRSTWRCVHSELAKSSKLCRSFWLGSWRAESPQQIGDGTWHLSPRASSLLPCRDFWTFTIPSLPNTWGVGRNPVVDTWVCLKIWYTERAINTKMMINQCFFSEKKHFKVTQ